MSDHVWSIFAPRFDAALAEGGTPVAPHAVHAVLAGEGAQPATVRTVAAAAARYGVSVAARRAA